VEAEYLIRKICELSEPYSNAVYLRCVNDHSGEESDLFYPQDQNSPFKTESQGGSTII